MLKDYFNFGLVTTPEIEKQLVFAGLTKKTIHYEPLLSDLIDTAYTVQYLKRITPEQVLILEKGLYETYDVVCFHYSGKFLSSLSYIEPSICKDLILLANHTSLKVRFNIITTMLYRPFDELLHYVLKRGLEDKSIRVRGKTGDVIERLDLPEYADLLTFYIKKEQNLKTKGELEHSLFWITHDYQLTKKDYGYSLWIKTVRGFSETTIDEKDLVNIDDIVENIKNNTKRAFEGMD